MAETRGEKFLARIGEEVLAGDGAMGTLLYERGIGIQVNPDALNLVKPELIEGIHREYIAAGARLVETNTYGANRFKLGKFGLEEKAREINLAGARIARKAAGEDVFVAGAVGPLTPTEIGSGPPKEESAVRGAFEEQIVALAEGGADLILLETFSNLSEILLALEVAKEITDLPVGCQMAFLQKGRTVQGAEAVDALGELESAGAAFVGANCGRGPLGAIHVIQRMAQASPIPLAAFPNAGFPQYVGGRYYYLMTPEYLAESAKELATAGANLIGGCCGTTPEEIRIMAQAIKGLAPAPRVVTAVPAAPKRPAVPDAPPRPPHFLDEGGPRPLILAEIDPPKGMRTKKSLAGIKSLVDAGAHTITVGDNPLAILRLGQVAFAYRVREMTGIDPVIHFSCRDRNLIGTQSTLMGAHLLGIRTVLALTGDPARVGNQPNATSVFDLNSFTLLELIAKLNSGENLAGSSIGQKTDFIAGVAFNPNVRRLDAQVSRLERKVKLGAKFSQTQPVFDIEKAKEVYKVTAGLGIPIFIGLFPLTSWKNAEFLHNEVPGIEVPEEIRKRMRAAGDDGLEAGLEICKEMIDELIDTVPGFYIIAPFNKAAVARVLVEHIRSRAPSGDDR